MVNKGSVFELCTQHIKSDNKAIDITKLRFGLRTISIDPANGLLVTGNPIKIKGTKNHQDHAGVGSALPDYLQYYIQESFEENEVIELSEEQLDFLKQRVEDIDIAVSIKCIFGMK